MNLTKALGHLLAAVEHAKRACARTVAAVERAIMHLRLLMAMTAW